MPSPFPGMDPYLEGDLWTSFHAQIAVEIATQLNPKLRPRYVALPQRRSVMDAPDDVTVSVESAYPDVALVEAASGRTESADSAAYRSPFQMATLMPEPVPHTWIEIRDVKRRRLVTAIEFLSPTNKRGLGRLEYLEKRDKVLHSTAHLLEIDLLRRGLRVPMRQALPKSDYFVFVGRADKRPITDIWRISLKEPLPVMPVPLLRGDPDVKVDLQKVFADVYDKSSFDLLIDYTEPPAVPLPRELAAWAKARIRSWTGS
jgi:hypothetical protein